MAKPQKTNGPDKKLKRYIIRKYVMARSAQEALRLSRTRKPDDVWVDDDWKKEKHFDSAIGFSIDAEDKESTDDES